MDILRRLRLQNVQIEWHDVCTYYRKVQNMLEVPLTTESIKREQLCCGLLPLASQTSQSPCGSVHQGGYVSVHNCVCGEIRQTDGCMFKEKDTQRSRDRGDTDRERQKQKQQREVIVCTSPNWDSNLHLNLNSAGNFHVNSNLEFQLERGPRRCVYPMGETSDCSFEGSCL